MLLINHNGKLLSAEQPLFKSSNRAFRYGDGLFESIRMLNGKFPFLPYHVERLIAGMEYLKIKVPQEFSVSFFEKTLTDLANANDNLKNARCRTSIYRTDGGFYQPEKNEAEYLIEASPLEPHQFQLNEKGLAIDIFSDVKKKCEPLSNIKSNNALPYVLASKFSEEQGVDDCLLLNTESRIAEGSYSNVFLVNGKELVTPALGEGCVAGVMRRIVMEIAVNSGYQVFETQVEVNYLITANELFLTNAISGIRWVEKYKEKTYGNDGARELTEQLNRLIQQTTVH